MRHFSSMKAGEISLIASEKHNSLIVIVESLEEPLEYDTTDEPGAADIFDNLHAKWNQTLELNEDDADDGINLAVFSYDNRFVRDNEATAVLKRIDSNIKKLAAKMDIDPANVGVILASSEITRKCFKDGFDYINVLVANPSDKRKKFPIKMPFETEIAYTNSVPTWLWTKSGSIKDDGAGVNLLGYIVRAASVVMYRQTEASIYKRMRDYHSGKYGQLQLVETLDKFEEMMLDLEAKKYNAIDTEGDNLNRINNTLLAIQFCTVNKRTDIPTMWVIPWHHSDTPWTRAELKYIRKRLKRYFERDAKNQIHVYQNAKFDIHQFISALGIRWYAARVYDVSSGSFSLEENQKFFKPLQISPYALEHMERTMEYNRPSTLVIKKADRGKMATFSIPDIAKYGVIDVLTTLFIMFEQIEVAKNRGYKGFFTFITRQMGPMIMAMTEMEHNGISIDMEYLKEIASPIGPFATRIRETAANLATSKAGKKANKKLVEASAYQQRGLFGNVAEPQLWNIRDKKHLRLLFFDILGLEPLSFGKDDMAALNKKFKKVYRHTAEVKTFSDYEKLQKLKSAFANALYKFMISDPDMMHDQRLRPIFGYLFVLTGRSSTTKPSTQQIPTHGPDAKIIKKQFKVKKRRILLKSDFSAHEVRVSGNISDDPTICGVVDKINAAQLKYRLASTDEEIMEFFNGLLDAHILNYESWYGVKITKDDPRRQDAKIAVFGVTYGSREPSIADGLLLAELYGLEDKLVKNDPPLSKKDISKIEERIRFLRSEEGWQEYLAKAYDLLATLRESWKVLTGYINRSQKQAKTDNVIFGPHKRPRHLWGHIHFDKFIGFAMDRRVFNSMSQGYASDIGFTAIYLAKKLKWDLFDSRGKKIDSLQTNAVHDSSFNELDFKYLPLMAYLQEHSMISETNEYYEEHFGIKPKAQYGFEFEIGPSEADLTTWDSRTDSPLRMKDGQMKGPQSLINIIKHYGPIVGYSEKEIAHVLHDAKVLGKLRTEELRMKVDRTTLKDKHIYDRIVPRLRCFKAELWDDETDEKRLAA